ncbi:hypothetical protein [Sphingobium herbicidovorans]|nr:hypothetical protein [Sphingobium herbicidovorans]
MSAAFPHAQPVEGLFGIGGLCPMTQGPRWTASRSAQGIRHG